MNISIIGAGAIGLLLAGTLAGKAKSLELVARSESQAAKIRSEGLQVDGSVIVPSASMRVVSFDGIVAYSIQPEADYVLLTVKQSALDDGLMRYAADRIQSGGKLVCFQNGLGHIEKLLQFVPAERLVVAVTTEGAKRTGEASVLHTGSGVTYLGHPDPNLGDSRNSDIKDLCNLLKTAGFRSETSNRIMSKVWNKLVINAAINPVTALLRVPNGNLLASPSALSLMRDIYEEALQAASLRAIPLAPDLWEQVEDVCRKTHANHSSMLQDVLSGRRTEIDWITGALLGVGRSGGLSLPVNETVYRLVKALEPE